MNGYWGIIVLLFIFGACSDGEDENIPASLPDEKVFLSLSGEGYIDSAQVFFFKELETRDSLIRREVVHGISFPGNTFDFILPVGYYKMIVFGNVETRYIKASPPYSSSDILIDYSLGEEPAVIYYARGNVNVGGQGNTKFAMVLATSSVQLTIKDIPAGIKRIRVDLYNTGGGVYVDTKPFDKVTDPALNRIINDVRADSSYTVLFSCFPTVAALGLSTLGVRCYDEQDDIKFTGISSPFSADSRRKVVVTSNFSTRKMNAKLVNITGTSFLLKPVK